MFSGEKLVRQQCHQLKGDYRNGEAGDLKIFGK